MFYIYILYNYIVTGLLLLLLTSLTCV